MKKIFLSLLFVSQFAFGVTGNSVWRIPSGATIPSWGPVNLADGTNAITGALPSKLNLPPVGIVTSSSSGLTSRITASFADVPNLSVSITVVGRPVHIFAQTDNTLGVGWKVSGPTSSCSSSLQILRGASSVWEQDMFSASSGASSGNAVGANFVEFYDTAASAGTYTYKVQWKGDGVCTITTSGVILMAYEM